MKFTLHSRRLVGDWLPLYQVGSSGVERSIKSRSSAQLIWRTFRQALHRSDVSEGSSEAAALEIKTCCPGLAQRLVETQLWKPTYIAT